MLDRLSAHQEVKWNYGAVANLIRRKSQFPLDATTARIEPETRRIELGDVAFEANLLARQLRTDQQDDWFPDPLSFNDMVSGDSLAIKFADNLTKHQGRYLPTDRNLFNVPKSNLTLRYALETGITDRALYHGLTHFLMRFYDPLIPWNVFNHRVEIRETKNGSPFKPAISAWKDFIGSARSALPLDGVLLSTDISNYYEHIDIIRLQTTLLDLLPQVEATPVEKAQIRARIDLLLAYLSSWAYTKTRGLPQNRDASSFLANLYMQPVDRLMRERGYADTYFRYMDDIKIVCVDRFHARRALKDLVLALRQLDLSVNSKKTEICDGAVAKGPVGVLSEGPEDVQYLDVMWKTKAREPILRSIPRLKQLTLDLIERQQADSREFRFCINRLVKLALCQDLYVPAEFFLELTAAMIKSLITSPAATDKLTEYLAAVSTTDDDLERVAQYLRDHDKAIYDWQNYRLWMLLGYKRYRSNELMDCARAIIEGTDDSPTRAGATVYAGSTGADVDRVLIAERFASVGSFLGQRSALVAVHELPFEPTIKEHVAPHVRDDLRGVYSELRRSRGKYYNSPKRIPLTELMFLDRGYD
jgi:hypothetical protein